MTATFVQAPPDGSGKMLAHDSWAQGANTVYGQDVVLYGPDGNPLITAAATPAGTEKGLITRPIPSVPGLGQQTGTTTGTGGNKIAADVAIYGGSQTNMSGAITTATSVVGGATDCSTANNATVIISGTHAGVNVTFEGSMDAGTTWVPIAGVRDDTGIAEFSTGVLVANQARAWNFALVGYNRFRVRATAWTSGSASVVVDVGSMPFEPMVSNVMSIPNRTILVLATATAGVTPAATEALATLAQCQRGNVALSSGTSFALSAGRIFRVQSMTLSVRASTTTAVTATAVLRYNPSGAVTATSPVIAMLTASSPSAVAAVGEAVAVSFPDGKDLPAGVTPGQIGISLLGTTATGLAVVSVEGFEYG